VWVALFWNRRIESVYNLSRVPVFGPVPRTLVRPGTGGVLEDARRVGIRERYVVAGAEVALAGERVAQGGTFALWRVEPPVRLVSRTTGVRLVTGDIDADARMTGYDCAGSALALDLVVPEPRRIQLFRNGRLYRELHLRAGERWVGRVPARPGARCTFRLLSFRGGVHANRFELVRAG
jgi:hypothetical protein